MVRAPRTLIEQIEAHSSLPAGSEERFHGYGVMGLPFASGHVLALRRFPVSSVGPGYTSIWHRTPDGVWTFYATVSPNLACTRFFGELASDAIETEIRIEWRDPYRFSVAAAAIPL